MNRTKHLALTIAAIGVAGFGLTGCNSSGHVKKADVEKQVTTQVTSQLGEAPKSVTCDGDLPGKVGATQRCLVTATDGSSIGLTVKVTTVDGNDVHFDAEVDPSTSSGPSASATP